MRWMQVHSIANVGAINAGIFHVFICVMTCLVMKESKRHEGNTKTKKKKEKFF